MKVFTVGMDQKPPVVVEKSESPPPGYASTAATPLPMGPEIAPIIVRKSRGYKGILMVMLAVFLMAIFALTLSEIAYNRQRDENFFRLQWAQLKHRMGYNDFGHRIIPINQGNSDLPDIAALQKQDQPTSTSDPVVPKIFIEPSASQESSSSSSEQQNNPSDNFARDARLQFLRQILQRIKQNAEQMGFDGTMQVSVIEVDPQNMAEFSGKKSPSEDPRSDAFLDSFGEFHAPSPFGSHGPPPMREINENSIVPPQQGRQWGAQPMPSEFNGFEVPMPPFPQQMAFRPDMMAFRPEWNMQPQQPQGQRPEMEEQWGRHPETFELHPKSAEFASPSQEIMGEIYGRKFGRMLQDLIAARIQNSLMQQQAQQAQPNQMMMQNLVMPMRPSFPIESGPQQQNQPEWWNQEPSIPQPQQVFPPQAPPAIAPSQPTQSQEQKPEQPSQQQVPSQQNQAQPNNEQFGQNFPQPQFPVFVSPEDRIQIEPPNGGALWQPPQPQQVQNTDEKQQIPHATLDFMPQPRAWTHQSESAPAPSMAPLVDGESQQQPQQSVEESSSNLNEPQENRIVILKKQPVDGEKHEEFGSSQLSDLPLKELQGQLAAAAAALSAQQTQDLQEQQQRFDEEAKNRNSDLQRPQAQEADLFKSIEQAQKQEAPQMMVEIPEEPLKQEQQPVEPAPVQNEHNNDETSEQVVDFPAVKFPNVAPSADAPSAPMNDMPDQQGGIFFQVDEPQHNGAQQGQHNMAGFV